MQLDFYDDFGGRLLKARCGTASEVPDIVKQAAFVPELALPDSDFALVLLEDGGKLQKFATIDPGNTFLSTVYFLDNGHVLTKEAQEVAAARLVEACLRHDLYVPEPLLKIAAGEGLVMGSVSGLDRVSPSASALADSVDPSDKSPHADEAVADLERWLTGDPGGNTSVDVRGNWVERPAPEAKKEHPHEKVGTGGEFNEPGRKLLETAEAFTPGELPVAAVGSGALGVVPGALGAGAGYLAGRMLPAPEERPGAGGATALGTSLGALGGGALAGLSALRGSDSFRDASVVGVPLLSVAGGMTGRGYAGGRRAAYDAAHADKTAGMQLPEMLQAMQALNIQPELTAQITDKLRKGMQLQHEELQALQQVALQLQQNPALLQKISPMMKIDAQRDLGLLQEAQQQMVGRGAERMAPNMLLDDRMAKIGTDVHPDDWHFAAQHLPISGDPDKVRQATESGLANWEQPQQKGPVRRVLGQGLATGVVGSALGGIAGLTAGRPGAGLAIGGGLGALAGAGEAMMPSGIARHQQHYEDEQGAWDRTRDPAYRAALADSMVEKAASPYVQYGFDRRPRVHRSEGTEGLLSGKYPCTTYAHCEKAASYFEDNGHLMPPADRREYCKNLAERASVFGADHVVEKVASYAGTGFGPRFQMFLEARRGLVEDEFLPIIDHLKHASLTDPGFRPEDAAEVIEQMDKAAGLDIHWGGAVADPWETVFTLEKTADYRYETTDGHVVTGEYLKELVLNHLTTLKSQFDHHFVSEFQKNPEAVFKSLPEPTKNLIGRMALDMSAAA